MAQKQLYTDGWEFQKFPYGTAYDEAVKKERGFLPVEIPHDWQIYDASFFMKIVPDGIEKK